MKWRDGQRVVVRGAHHGVVKGDSTDGNVFIRFDSGNSGLFADADVSEERPDHPSGHPPQDKSLRPTEVK